ncbi:hypothetical protein M0812_05057 [Anaeramoeba flamelloides]|uniref:Uncharacterized protein n=1 Tax=Anaeramoeba flamelloides TaxID=1746091 RepID=A0AAV8AEZ9_9EUKA|nr:hypothetical protein M0812_05057 [Anaeramoeba flamelloides]
MKMKMKIKIKIKIKKEKERKDKMKMEMKKKIKMIKKRKMIKKNENENQNEKEIGNENQREKSNEKPKENGNENQKEKEKGNGNKNQNEKEKKRKNKIITKGALIFHKTTPVEFYQNLYSYVFNKEKTKECIFFGEIEDIDHFLWKCNKCKESRDKWLSKQKENLQLNKIKKDQNPTLLLAKINNPEIYYNLVKFIKECLDIRGSVDNDGD